MTIGTHTLSIAEQENYVKKNWMKESDKKMAQKLGISLSSIRKRRYELEIVRTKRHNPSPLSKKQMKILDDQYGLYDVKHFAMVFNVSKDIIYRSLKLLDIDPSENGSTTDNMIRYRFKQMGFNTAFEAREKLGHWKWANLIEQFKKEFYGN